MRGLDRWIEEGTLRGDNAEFSSRHAEPPTPRGERGPSLLKDIASPYADLPAAELVARLRATLQRDWRTSEDDDSAAHRAAFEKGQGQ